MFLTDLIERGVYTFRFPYFNGSFYNTCLTILNKLQKRYKDYIIIKEAILTFEEYNTYSNQDLSIFEYTIFTEKQKMFFLIENSFYILLNNQNLSKDYKNLVLCAYNSISLIYPADTKKNIASLIDTIF